MSPRLRRLLRRGLVASGALIAVAAAALFLASRYVDAPSVRAQIQRQLSQAIQGEVEWDALEVRLFPRPHAALQNVRARIPDRLVAHADRIDIGLRLAALVRGRPGIRSVTLVRPVAQIRLPRPAPTETAPAAAAVTDPISVYRAAAQPAMDAIRRFAPDMLLTVEAGTFEILARDLPAISASNVSLQVQADSSGVTARASAAGNYWQRLQAEARVEFADLRARAALDVAEVKPQPLLDHILSGMQTGIGLPNISLHAEASTDGRTSAGAKLRAEAPSASLSPGDRKIEVGQVRLDAELKLGADGFESLIDARLGELLPAGQARLRHGQNRWQAVVEIPKLDMSRLRDAAVALAGDQAAVRDLVARVGGGQLADIRLTAAADTLPGILHLPNLSASLTLANGNARLPGIEQEAREIHARLELDNKTLKMRDARASLEGLRLLDGSLEFEFEDMRINGSAGFDADLGRTLETARRALPANRRGWLKRIDSVTGTAQGRLAAELRGEQWSAEASIARSDSVARLRGIPWPIRLHEGRVKASAKRIQISDLGGRVGGSSFGRAKADLALGAAPRIAAATATATLVLDEIYPWLRSQENLAQALGPVAAVTGSAEVTLNSLSGRADRPAALAYDLTVSPRNARMETADLPAPVSLDGGSLRVTPQAVSLQRLSLAMLDAAVRVSGAVKEPVSQKAQAELALADGVAGEKFLDWLWQRARIPQRLQPATPVRFSAERLRWSRDDGIELAGSAQPGTGPTLGLDLGWRPGAIEIKRLTIKDADSDATFGLQARGRELGASFAGVLTGRSVAAMLAHAPGEHPGRVAGDFRATFDRDHLDRISTKGRLSGERINLAMLLPLPLELERIEVQADGAALRVHEAAIVWAEQKAMLRGEVTYTAAGPVVQAQLDSPGIDLDALRAVRGQPQDKVEPVAEETRRLLELWPLPLTGKLAVSADYLQSRGYRVQPVRATLTLEPQRAHIDVTEAAVCGIAFPFVIDATPQGLDVKVRLTAKDQQLEDVARCFSEQRVLITGRFDLAADLTSKGAIGNLFANPAGPVQFRAYDGRIRKSTLLGNILALKNVSSLLTKGFKFDAQGFDYREISLRGRFAEGRFNIEQASLDSSALGLAAAGTVALADRKADLTVLVAPFGSIDHLVRKIPVLGYLLGGAITSVPVGVSGDIRDPVVTPLGSKAVTSELAGIFERTFRLPGKVLEPFETAQPAAR